MTKDQHMRHYILSAIIVAGLGLITSCGGKQDESASLTGVGINLQDMDTTINPADDFYRYANGGWIARTKIPPTEGRWGSFNELRENTLQAVHEVLKEAEASGNYSEGSDHRKALDFFSVGMDSLSAENAGSKPLQKYYNQINAIKSNEDLQRYLVEQLKIQSGAFFRLAVDSDRKKSDVIALYITSGGLGLPERDYYVRKDEKSIEIRNKYQQHVQQMMVLSGIDGTGAESIAKNVMDIETRLANTTMTKEDRRNPEKTYNKRSIGQLAEMVPSISWKECFAALGIENIDSVIVSDPAFLIEMEKVIRRSGLDAVKGYLRWHLVRSAAPYLNHSLIKENFGFYTYYLLWV
jgi:putative endopeptidase